MKNRFTVSILSLVICLLFNVKTFAHEEENTHKTSIEATTQQLAPQSTTTMSKQELTQKIEAAKAEMSEKQRAKFDKKMGKLKNKLSKLAEKGKLPISKEGGTYDMTSSNHKVMDVNHTGYTHGSDKHVRLGIIIGGAGLLLVLLAAVLGASSAVISIGWLAFLVGLVLLVLGLV